MCTSVACGRKATKDEVTLIARNEDFKQNNWNKYIKYRKQSQYAALEKTEMWHLGNGLIVPVPEKSYSYCSIPDAQGQEEAECSIGDYFLFEERGINEKNVAISATNSMEANEKAQAADPMVQIGIEESILLTLLLPQAETARQTVELLGEYVTKYGASEPNGILIGDENEVWYFEIGSGHYWIAVRIPDDSYLVVSNCMRIHDVDLEDINNVICPINLYDFVDKNKLLEIPDKVSFDFAEAFGHSETYVDGEPDPYYNIDRLWLAQSILTPSIKQQVRKTVYPLFLRPDKPITLDAIKKVLRATFHGTILENVSSATRPIGVVRTTESHIMIIDKTMPNQLKGVIWQAIGSPLGSAYFPFYAVMSEIPKGYAMGNSEEYNEQSVYWSWKANFAVAGQKDSLDKLKYSNMLIEKKSEEKHKLFASFLKDLANEKYENAVSLAQSYSTGILSIMEIYVHAQLNYQLAQSVIEQKDIL